MPDADDTTFQTAVVKAVIGGIEVSVDFLSHVKGVRRGLEEGVVDLTVPYRHGDAEGEVELRLMHPLHCFQSRVANIVALRRKDATAQRQLEAAPIVLREFVVDMLDDGDPRSAIDTLVALFRFLHADIIGRDAYKVMRNDPLDIFRRFLGDDRLDARWRAINLASMVRRLEDKRKLIPRMIEGLGRWVPPPKE